jgi:DNA topoisomerase-1
MNLMIVESPNKVKKIRAFLCPGWEVAASVGHVRGLPVKSLGVDGTRPGDMRAGWQAGGGRPAAI